MVDRDSEDYKEGKLNGCLSGFMLATVIPFLIIGGWTFGVWFVQNFLGG